MTGREAVEHIAEHGAQALDTFTSNLLTELAKYILQIADDVKNLNEVNNMKELDEPMKMVPVPPEQRVLEGLIATAKKAQEDDEESDSEADPED